MQIKTLLLTCTFVSFACSAYAQNKLFFDVSRAAAKATRSRPFQKVL